MKCKNAEKELSGLIEKTLIGLWQYSILHEADTWMQRCQESIFYGYFIHKRIYPLAYYRTNVLFRVQYIFQILSYLFDRATLIMNIVIRQLERRKALFEKMGRLCLSVKKTYHSCLLRHPAPWSILIYAVVCSQQGTYGFSLAEWYLSTAEWENCPASESMTNSISCTMLTFNQQSWKG